MALEKYKQHEAPLEEIVNGQKFAVNVEYKEINNIIPVRCYRHCVFAVIAID